MFSPLNDPQVEHWFQRLNGPLKRLPADERTQIHQEVRQHLEALATANEELGSSPHEAAELALMQFGDPGKFGKRMAQEWSQGKMGFRADAAAIGFVLSYQTLLIIAWTVSINAWTWLYGHHNQPFAGTLSELGYLLSFGGTAVLYATLGRKYPFQAVKGAFYGDLLFTVCNLTWFAGMLAFGQFHPQPPLSASIGHALLWTLRWLPLWLAAKVAVAYLASVTKRGWYKPTWEDFKLTWPKRRIMG